MCLRVCACMCISPRACLHTKVNVYFLFPQTVLFLFFPLFFLVWKYFCPVVGFIIIIIFFFSFFFRSCLVSLSLPVICEVESQASSFGSDFSPVLFWGFFSSLFSVSLFI